jgi:hypothetical protein
MADLFGMLSRLGIEPMQQSGSTPCLDTFDQQAGLIEFARAIDQRRWRHLHAEVRRIASPTWRYQSFLQSNW